MDNNLSMKTGRLTNLSKAIEIIAKHDGKILREELSKHFNQRSFGAVIEDLMYGVAKSAGPLVKVEKVGRKSLLILNEKGKKWRQQTANDLSKFLNSKGVKAKPKTLFESYLLQAKEYNEDLSMAALDPETSKFMVDTLLQRIKNKKEDTSVYAHLKKVISKWNLFEYAKKKIAELKLNPRIMGLLGIK